MNKLTKYCLAQTFFGIGCRPSELLCFAKKTATNGITFADIKYVKNCLNSKSLPKKDRYWRFVVRRFKNQKLRNVPKIIYIGISHCKQRKQCIQCNIFNPAALIWLMIMKRKELLETYQNTIKKNPSLSKEKQKRYSKIISGLTMKPKNFLFVWADGKPVKITDLGIVAKEVATLNNLTEASRYKAYSFRIGTTSTAVTKGIPHPKILSYIGWAANNLPHVSYRYTRYTDEELKRFQYELVHGSYLDDLNLKQKIIKLSNRFFDPWMDGLNYSSFSQLYTK